MHAFLLFIEAHSVDPLTSRGALEDRPRARR